MSYAGDVTCSDCFRALLENQTAQLIDVRTSAEWNFVGVPDLGQLGRQPILVEWQSYPTMNIDPEFVNTVVGHLDELGLGKDTPTYFLCRSGVRSKSSAIAMTSAGFSNAFNIAGGFEGNHNEARHRGTKEGWKFDGLPWKQG